MTTPTLARVLKEHGGYCNCPGTCGVEHSGLICERGAASARVFVNLVAAPQFPSARDVENAAAPLSELRPWCVQCLNRAITRARENAAELRRIDHHEEQLGLDLFGAS